LKQAGPGSEEPLATTRCVARDQDAAAGDELEWLCPWPWLWAPCEWELAEPCECESPELDEPDDEPGELDDELDELSPEAPDEPELSLELEPDEPDFERDPRLSVL